MTAEPTLWWRDAAVYQVYVRSFADGDGDGVGDLPGIIDKLPYLAGLGVDAVWLTPFYRSPMADHGYDVSDQCSVDPLFGTLADLDRLLTRAHELRLRVIVDVVPNHSSDEHPWFRTAIQDPNSALRDRYLFRKPGPGGGPPNNWQSVFGGPAWTWDDASGEYYLHLFDPRQPDLNWRHPAVHAEWERILRFWLDRGVDGFRIDVAHGLYKQAELRDHAPAAPDPLFHASTSPHAYDQPEVLEVYRRWRQIVDEYDDRVLVGEVFLADLDRVVRYVGPDLLHQCFNFPLLAAPLEASTWRALVQTSLDALDGPGASPTWVLSNHDVVRHATRYGGGEQGRHRARAATLTLLALPGSPYLFEGEELGLEQSDVPPEARQDPIWRRSAGTVEGRDGCRTPLPWTSQPPGHGFTAGRPWLPFDDQAEGRSVEAQEGYDDSTLTFYRRALALRRALRDHLSREVRWLDGPDELLAFARSHDDGDALVCVLNTGGEPRDLVLPGGRLLLSSRPSGEPRPDVLEVPGGTAMWLRAQV